MRSENSMNMNLIQFFLQLSHNFDFFFSMKYFLEGNSTNELILVQEMVLIDVRTFAMSSHFGRSAPSPSFEGRHMRNFSNWTHSWLEIFQIEPKVYMYQTQ